MRMICVWKGLDRHPALVGNVPLNEVQNSRSFPYTGIYSIGEEIPGKPAVLFIHGALGTPKVFFDRIKEYGSRANIYVFKYDYKLSLENSDSLREWLGKWARYLGTKDQKGAIIVAHSFGANVLLQSY